MTHCLSVDGSHLVSVLRMLAKRLRKVKPDERAILGFDGKCLTIEVRDTLAFAQAVGTWPGNANVSATLIAALAAAPPAGKRITLSCDGATVKFGTVKIDCNWRPVSAGLQDLPAAKDWIRGIAIRYSMPRGEIVREGLASEVANAERKLDALVKRTARALAPVGVTLDDLRELVERRLEERYAGRQ